jgi:hypothetical protein
LNKRNIAAKRSKKSGAVKQEEQNKRQEQSNKEERSKRLSKRGTKQR